jgi:hypothetical protein
VETPPDETGALEALLGDGRFLLALTGVALIGSGGFALFLCLTGHFLPHDVARLGMDAPELAKAANRELVNFMFHDRAAFGGSMIVIGILYLWIVGFPLRQGEAWAWWTLVVSGVVGFGSFLCYLGYGYLDTWHGVATLFLLPIYLAGLARSRKGLREPSGWRSLLPATAWGGASGRQKAGRLLLLTYGMGLCAAGATIMGIGMSSVFVPEDLAYIGLSRPEICGISGPLVPIIAHDRAGFGGGLCSIGVTVILLVLHARPVCSFRQVMLVTGLTGFCAAISVHFFIGYTNMKHLAPAFAGAAIFLGGWWLSRPRRDKAAAVRV